MSVEDGAKDPLSSMEVEADAEEPPVSVLARLRQRSSTVLAGVIVTVSRPTSLLGRFFAFMFLIHSVSGFGSTVYLSAGYISHSFDSKDKLSDPSSWICQKWRPAKCSPGRRECIATKECTETRQASEVFKRWLCLQELPSLLRYACGLASVYCWWHASHRHSRPRRSTWFLALAVIYIVAGIWAMITECHSNEAELNEYKCGIEKWKGVHLWRSFDSRIKYNFKLEDFPVVLPPDLDRSRLYATPRPFGVRVGSDGVWFLIAVLCDAFLATLYSQYFRMVEEAQAIAQSFCTISEVDNEGLSVEFWKGAVESVVNVREELAEYSSSRSVGILFQWAYHVLGTVRLIFRNFFCVASAPLAAENIYYHFFLSATSSMLILTLTWQMFSIHHTASITVAKLGAKAALDAAKLSREEAVEVSHMHYILRERSDEAPLAWYFFRSKWTAVTGKQFLIVAGVCLTPVLNRMQKGLFGEM
eukprot:TRINITY_DN50205_c0_g1_i1.p1 TRINITY_DN50205_c0_g1~~TRINITY_DN50205_c0_g1_i1.p1  ORF type:complete len:474 (+),score=34.76 TRINITY_DN50205_c0_g1_i1:81-1502(+)